MCQGPIGPKQISCIAATLKKFLPLQINIRTGFLDLENLDKGTKIDFLSQILRKLWGIEYLARLAQTAISFFAYMTEKLLKGAGVRLWGCGVALF